MLILHSYYNICIYYQNTLMINNLSIFQKRVQIPCLLHIYYQKDTIHTIHLQCISYKFYNYCILLKGEEYLQESLLFVI